MSIVVLPPMQYHHRRARSQLSTHQQQQQQQQMAYTNSYGHTADFAHAIPCTSRPAYSRSRQATAYRQQSTDLPYLSSISHGPPERCDLDPQVESSYIQRYLDLNGGRMEAAYRFPEWRAQHKRQDRHVDRSRLRVSRSHPSATASSAISYSSDSSSRAAHLRNPQPRAAHLFPFDDSELAAVRSMWFDQGRRGLNLIEGLVRPTSAEDSSASKQDGLSTGDDSTSSSASTAPSALFDSTSLSSDTTASSVETVRSPASKMAANTNKGKGKVAIRSPSRARTTTALSVNTSSDGLSPPQYTAVSPDESPLHIHAQTVLEGILDEQDRRRSHHFEEKLQGTSHPSLTPQTLETVPPKYSRRRAQSVSESNLSTLAALTRPFTWLAPVESLVEFVGRLPNAYIPTTPNLPHHHQARTRSSSRPTHRRRSASLPALRPSALIQQTSEQTAALTDFDIVDQPLINLLPLPLHPSPPPRTPVIPPVRSLPRSPYRPLTPPATPTPRIRIIPNQEYLRLKALQNRVLWGLVSVDRGECEVLRRVGIGMRGSSRRKDRQRGGGSGSGGAVGGWFEEVDREGRMCSGREARFGVAVEGRQRSILSHGDVLVIDESADPREVKKWWLSMTWSWAGA